MWWTETQPVAQPIPLAAAGQRRMARQAQLWTGRLFADINT
jgi:hypothetical protein